MNDASVYDALLDAGREPSPPCPVCTGERDAEPCSEDCDRIMRASETRHRIKGLYEAAWRALGLAREYRVGDATSDYRIKAIKQQVYFYRQDIAELRRAA